MSSKDFPDNIPPKDIIGAIHGPCFDYRDYDEEIDGQTIQERIYWCWQRITEVVLANDNGQSFIEYIKKQTPVNPNNDPEKSKGYYPKNNQQ